MSEEQLADYKEQVRIQMENRKIEENFDKYAELDAEAESKKLQDAALEKKVKKAEIHLLEPRSRFYETRANPNYGPCGGAERAEAHYLTSTGKRNYFQWKTLKSHDSANCTIKLSTGFEDFENDFKVLRPRDDSGDADGKFPCGRKSGFEGKEFRIPEELKCERCVIQLTQEVGKDEVIYQCADIVILEDLTTNQFINYQCPKACLNGGFCQNGKCICRQGFLGDQCEVIGK